VPLKNNYGSRQKKRTNANWFSFNKLGKGQTLISTSTPLGNSSFIRASIVLVLVE
jgi:hypothetical protein